MEQLNQVSLRGTIGGVNLSNVGGKTMQKLSLATNYVYKDKDGYSVIETTWHNLVFWGDDVFQKGDKVEVSGRIRNTRYTDKNGEEHYATEIIVSKITKLVVEEPLECEMAKKKKCSFDVYFTPMINVEYEVEDAFNLTDEEYEQIIDTAIQKACMKFSADEVLYDNFERIEVYKVDGKTIK